MHKQLWGYLLITLSLAGFTPLQAQTDSADEGGYITLSGIVKDKKSKKSLEYVNISIPGSTTGTVTNADGEFSFKVKDSIHAKEVEISHLGYFNSKIELNGKDVEEQTVWLTPYTNMLDEVIIHARDPRSAGRHRPPATWLRRCGLRSRPCPSGRGARGSRPGRRPATPRPE